MGKMDYSQATRKALDLGAVSVKDVDMSKRTVKFAFAGYGKPDSDGDIIHEGAYKKSYMERGPQASNQIKHFKWHDPRYTPGKLLEVFDDAGYGIGVSKIATTTLGNDTLIEYQEGLITEHSHGLTQINERNNDSQGFNHITEAKLWEVSTLNAWGAQSDTPMLEIKAIKDANELISLMDTINKYLSIGEFSDELLQKFETRLKQLQILHKQLIKPPASTQETEPLNDTLNKKLEETLLLFKN